MTREELLQLPAGSVLDLEVAKLLAPGVFCGGLRVLASKFTLGDTHPYVCAQCGTRMTEYGPKFHNPLPCYSGSILASWGILEYLAGIYPDVCVCKGYGREGWGVYFGDIHADAEGRWNERPLVIEEVWADTVALALCRALIIAKVPR